ncbi:MAG: hypothetical protein A2Y66_01735 [Nitrospirae bacterium RBG_13_41_22]|nr:MAG: hypothetical protein A2Y66_01735 [Nitrospirae bacterium RBG_13_41_22]
MNIDGYIASQFDGKHFKLHRIILGVENSDVNIDHINGDKSDNRKINLRLCTYMQNNHNQKLAKNNNSGYKGVYFRSKTSKWEANISFNYKRYHLGVFNSKEEAAQAYNKAAIKYYGEFANLNKITQDYVIATCQ